MENDESESSGRASTIGEIGSRFREDLFALRESALRRRDELLSIAHRYVDEHPFAAVGVAFAAGYVVAGGLLSRTTLRLLRVGARIYLGNLVKGVVGEAIGGGQFERGGDGASSRVAH